MTKLFFIGGSNHPIESDGLTLGKIYKGEYYIIGFSDARGYYSIINDHGLRHSYPKFLFKTLDEVRNEKLNILLN